MSHESLTSGLTLPEGKLLEGIVTTINADGSTHVAPMGPIVDHDFSALLLRPFPTSTTFENLKRVRHGVLHVTDDVELFARAAVGKLSHLPRTLDSGCYKGMILADACRWYAFRVIDLNESGERSAMRCEVIDRGDLRPFFGFNRAMHAVIEAAIAATRLHILDPAHVWAEFERLQPLVDKTGGRKEHAAFEFLKQHVATSLRTGQKTASIEND